MNDWFNNPDLPDRRNFAFQILSNLRPNFKRFDKTVGSDFGIEAVNALTLGKWHHVAVTWDKKLNVVKLFIDHVEDASKSFSSSFVEQEQMAWYQLGDDFYSENHQLDGSISDLYFIEGALTAEQLPVLTSMTTDIMILS